MVIDCENCLIKVFSWVCDWLKDGEVLVYSCRFSKHVFTQHQLLQGLVVKTLFRMRIRELVEMMQVADILNGFEPHTSLHYFSEVSGTFPVPHTIHTKSGCG